MRRASAAALLAFAWSCAGPRWRDAPHDLYFQSVPPPILHAPMAEQTSSEWWDAVDQSTVRPLGQVLSPGHHVGRLLDAEPALDVNAFGQVLDSGWYENRIARGMTPEAAARGPNSLDGPAPGPLLVIGGKVEGATPGLVVRDSADNVFVVKFDPPAFPEMSSGAEVIAARLLHAAGYHVPENYIVELDMARLMLAPGATTRGAYGAIIPMTPTHLRGITVHVNPFADGRVRAMFSRRIPGRVVGHFSYSGSRADDPNDRVPHERRRSLRGLWMFNAWLHNSDTTSLNTLDTFIEVEPGRGALRHYLIDFGDALGAGGTKPKYPGQGYEGDLDWLMVGQRLFSLGIIYPYWLPARRAPFRAVGIFEADVFEPTSWRPEVPNPAFDASTALDDYWAASVMARFTQDHLAAIVDTAGYSEPGAAQWVLRVLSERQHELMEHAFADVLPLDEPRVSGWRLALTDLADYASMLMAPGEARYRWAVSWDGEVLARGESAEPAVDLEPVARALVRRPGFEDEPFLTVTWWRPRGDDEGPSVEVHLRVAGERMLAVGLDRETGGW